MKILKVAILVNIVLYGIFLCGSVWALTKIFTAPNFQAIPSYPKLVFISFQVIGHAFPVFCIVGLALRKNWGRILALILNIIMVIGIGLKVFSNINIFKSMVFPLSPYSQHYIFSVIYLILFASLSIILGRPRTKQLFEN